MIDKRAFLAIMATMGFRKLSGSDFFKFRHNWGVHPADNKEETRVRTISEVPSPEKVLLLMSQHTGKPAIPIVKKGDRVLKYQKVGEAQDMISAPVHSSISGIVEDITTVNHPITSESVQAVVIKNDGKGQEMEPRLSYANYSQRSVELIRNLIKEAGIVGLGGAAFPTHVKLNPPKKVDTVLFNGCECEPYLTSDERLMIEETEKMVSGFKIIMYALGVQKGIVVIEDNKPEAIKRMEEAIKNEPAIGVKVIETKYPQGSEKQLINVVLGRVVPAGKLPFDVGVVVQNVATAYAVHQAVVEGIPLISRVVTVNGDGVKQPGNYRVFLGTLLEDLLKYAGYEPAVNHRVIMGGPMMGITQYQLSIPIMKCTTGVIVFDTPRDFETHYRACIRCSRCIDACPMKLMPNLISIYVEKRRFEETRRFYPLDCIECGCCAYVCVAQRPLVQQIKLAKQILTTK